MGKVDDMRRQREERVAADERAAKGRAAAAGGAPAPAIAPAAEPPAEAAPVAAATRGRGRATGDEEGVCSVCRKVRPLQNQLIASHQKGLGKFCPGSRKPPA
jgi:hypothetical protein